MNERSLRRSGKARHHSAKRRCPGRRHGAWQCIDFMLDGQRIASLQGLAE